MKRVLLFLIVLSMSCSKHDGFTDMSGHWVGQSKSLTVDFVLNPAANGNFAVSSATFSILGSSYNKLTNWVVAGVNNTWSIEFYDGNNYLVLNQVFVTSSDFTTMECMGPEQYLAIGQSKPVQIQETFTLTRK